LKRAIEDLADLAHGQTLDLVKNENVTLRFVESIESEAQGGTRLELARAVGRFGMPGVIGRQVADDLAADVRATSMI
jgi:hypothetical protein